MVLYRSRDDQTSFESFGLLVQEKKFSIDFQDGEHAGYLGFVIETFRIFLIYKSPR